MRMCGGLLRDLPGVGGGKCHAGQAAQSGRVWLVILLSLAGAVAPRAEARARVGFGPGGLAARWRSFVRVTVAGWRRTPRARRPRLARERWPRARHRGQRACSLESSCPSLSVRSCRMRLGLQWGQAAQLSSTLNRCDFHFSIDISDAYHLCRCGLAAGASCGRSSG